MIKKKLQEFGQQLEGDLFTDDITLILYSTDASVYMERPIGVSIPRTDDDLRRIIEFASNEGISIIPRTAGTSLAGQVVGGGLVVDISKHFNEIIELNTNEKWVRVRPGVVLDELNKFLQPHNLFFGPETSTSNRCMIGGMVGNNSCGAHSILYGSTRDHTISVKVILSDGSEAEFKSLNLEEFEEKCIGDKFENQLYRQIKDILSNPENQDEIRAEFPDKSIKRRNTGYAIDLLLDSEPFTKATGRFNFSKLIAGSEGTLALITEIKLNLVDLPPKEKGLVCIHFKDIEKAFHGNLAALRYNPGAIELIDHYIIDCTKGNIEQNKNRFFIEGEPQAILFVEFARNSREEILAIANSMETEMRKVGLGYHFPVIFGDDINKAWELRKAALGLLSNAPGDAKPVAVIEDTAVNVEFLPDYMKEFNELLNQLGLTCVFYAHIGSGELHLRPVLNLKNPKDIELFHTIGLEVAKLVKSYNGSLSGEHGDGRLRGEFIPMMIGEKNYKLICDIKKVWDPKGIFNPGKIVDTPKMNTNLRYQPGQVTKEINTYFDFTATKGIIRAVEKCNGSGDCRKSEVIGGVMCPSFMATRDERDSTRARANILRVLLSSTAKDNPFDQKEIHKVLDLCLMCKGCKTECPSSVDMAKLKSEFLYHYYKSNKPSLRSRLVANITSTNRRMSVAPGLSNFFIKNSFTSSLIKGIIGFAPQRKIPQLHKTTLRKWAEKNLDSFNSEVTSGNTVCLFVDEFTEYNDTEIGIKAIKILTKLGFKVLLTDHAESGRTHISKGFLKEAKEIAQANLQALQQVVNQSIPLIGIEPSALLTIRDEYPELVDAVDVKSAETLASNAYLFDEFIASQMSKGKIGKDYFSPEKRLIKLHGHCHQKVLSSMKPTIEMLSFPMNYSVEEIKSGCCGMSGAFGYEKEHYEVSMKVGELILFPEVRSADQDVVISAPGTSCRQQIYDGTGKKAYHPIELLFDALL